MPEADLRPDPSAAIDRSRHFTFINCSSKRKTSTPGRRAVVSAIGSWPLGMPITTPVHGRDPLGRHPPWRAQRTTERRIESTAPLRVPVRAAAMAQPYDGILLLFTVTREVALVLPAGAQTQNSRSSSAGSRVFSSATTSSAHAALQHATDFPSRGLLSDHSRRAARIASVRDVWPSAPGSHDRCHRGQAAATQLSAFSPARTFRSGRPVIGAGRSAARHDGCSAPSAPTDEAHDVTGTCVEPAWPSSARDV